MPPASSGDHNPSVLEKRDAKSEESSGNPDGELRWHRRLPLASTSSPSDDASAARALSSALFADEGGPLPPVSAAWAYGSGVFRQHERGSDGGTEAPSVDLLFAVADPREWHSVNLERNPSHYSGFARSVLGASGIARAGAEVGPGVWFNSGVEFFEATTGAPSSTASSTSSSPSSPPRSPPTKIKYGVASEESLLADLERWEELYLAGRLQKPTLRLPLERREKREKRPPPSSFSRRLELAMSSNGSAALAAALLLLPPTFSHDRLLSTLVSLSYSGDVRLVAAAEDPKKVEKIVSGTGRKRLDSLYGLRSSPPSPVAAAAGLVALCGGELWAQDPRKESRRELVEGFLPEGTSARVRAAFRSPSTTAGHFSSSSPSPLAVALRSSLASKVRSSSARAALVGLASAGPLGAASYVLAKLKKGGWGGKKA